MGDTDSFCNSCGRRLDSGISGTTTYQPYGIPRGRRPVSDVRGISFVLGLLLGIIGLVIALIVYSNDRDFEEKPTGEVVIWSIIGMLFWFVILVILGLMLIGSYAY